MARRQHHGVAALQCKGQLAKQLADSLAFLGALAPGQCCSYLLHLNNCASMEPPQGLHGEGQELETLLSTGFLSVPELPLNSFGEMNKTRGLIPIFLGDQT